MSTANFINDQLGFPLYCREDFYSKVCPECGCWNMESAETCEECGENLENVEPRYDELDNEIYFNEVNTIPGSLAFYLWEPAGVPYPELLEELISLARKRARKQSGITYSFDTNVFAMGGGMGIKNKGTKA